MRKPLTKISNLAILALLSGVAFAADETEMPSELEAEDGWEKKEPNRILVIEPKKTIDPAVAAREIRKHLELGSSLWKGGDHDMAERYFAAALGVPIDSPEKENVLFEMANLFKEDGMLPKAAVVLERLTEEFGESRRLPSVYMELGHLYRAMGGLEIAISNYYMVLNSSLDISIDQLERARDLSLNAKLEIAETHSELLEYEESYRHYELLSKLDLKPIERMRVDYRMCHLLYQLGRYQYAVPRLKQFLDHYRMSAHSPEIRYLLAKSYEKLSRKPEALKEVVQILQRQSSPDTALDGEADYWRQRTGNELANEFYEKRDYRSALTIYQSLAKYSPAPEWRWPAIHQIGLCFERLGLPEKAILAYQEILDPEGLEITEESLSPGLQSLRQMAKWRLEHLSWEDDLLARLNVLGAN
ncbi:MAG: tetratricopeptide repeat protein [Verrucomicrobiota bacterium]|nr:tetratricopeptide repeat protein [Verrucomicrobiota bacterium]